MFNVPQQPQHANKSRSGMPQHVTSGMHRRAGMTITNQAMQLIGRTVKINRGGPDSVTGRLLAVNGEVLVVRSMGTIVYVNAAHVKSITEGTSAGKGASAGKSTGANFINASSMNSLLTRLRHQFIQINRGGPEKIEGFLAEISSDSVLVVVGRELVRVPIFHIKTVNVSGGKSGGNKNNNQDGNKDGNKDGKSGGNRSRSQGRQQSSGGNRNRSRSGQRKSR